MKVRFWGVRGSIPSSLSGEAVRVKMLRALREMPEGADPEQWLAGMPYGYGATYGGETPCVEVTSGDDRIILDAGSGIRRLGLRMIHDGELGRPIHILLSHFHWDHIQGLPFFVPLLNPEAEVHIYNGRPDGEEFLAGQHSAPCFPLEFGDIPCRLKYHCVEGTFDIEGLKVSVIPVDHPSGAFAFRIEDGRSCVVYMTDVELLSAGKEQMKSYRDFVSGADVVIGDVQFGFVESYEKRTWGHSSVPALADVVAGRGVKKLAFYHYDPTSTDDDLDGLFDRAQEYARTQPGLKGVEMVLSHVGLELEI